MPAATILLNNMRTQQSNCSDNQSEKGQNSSNSIPARQGNVFNSMKVNSFKQQSVMVQHEKEMHLLPSTPKYYKRTYRHYFKRRMNQMERPVIIINFQGVLGDFLKDGGLSTKQDHLLSRAYIKEFNNSLK